MKYRYVILFILFSFSLCLGAIDLRFNPQGIAGGQYTVDVQAKATPNAFDLGSSNLFFSYNSSALSFNSGSSLNYDSGNYVSHDVSSNGSEISIAIFITPGNDGESLPTTWTDISRVVFDILDESASSNLQWGFLDINDDNGNAVGINNASDLDQSLPVELATFEAELAAKAVLLKWSTASEQDNQGFNLYRSASKNGTYEKLNGALIPGHGTTANTQEYEFKDDRIEANKTYFYRLEDVDINGRARQHGPIDIFVDPALMAPSEFSLEQNYPNPFNPGTTISYGLPEDTHVRLQIFNMKGQVVSTLVDALQPAGRYELRWNASTAMNGNSLPTGIYFYKLETADFTHIKKMIYTK